MTEQNLHCLVVQPDVYEPVGHATGSVGGRLPPVPWEWLRAGEGGNWYRSEDHGMEGWLCPALFKYFDEAPELIFARFEEKAAAK